ncbi:MAG: glycosyltransferase family 2 protein, partial [Candidatus Sigynarchaeota archaeon]
DNIQKNIDYPKERYEIIVVDNASTDDTFATIKRRYPYVSIYKLKKNVGISGWNLGMKKAKGDFFLLLDDDSNPEKGVTKAVLYLQKKKDIGILACRIRQLKKFREFPLLDFFGCGVFIRKELYDRIGGFAPWIFIYSHEWEYTIRCLDNCYKLVNFPACVVYHRIKKASYSSDRFIMNSIRNYFSIYYSYFSGFPMIAKVLMFSLWNLANLLKSRKERLFFEAVLSFLKNINNLKRKPISKHLQAKFNRIGLFQGFGKLFKHQ